MNNILTRCANRWRLSAGRNAMALLALAENLPLYHSLRLCFGHAIHRKTRSDPSSEKYQGRYWAQPFDSLLRLDSQCRNPKISESIGQSLRWCQRRDRPTTGNGRQNPLHVAKEIATMKTFPRFAPLIARNRKTSSQTLMDGCAKWIKSATEHQKGWPIRHTSLGSSASSPE